MKLDGSKIVIIDDEPGIRRSLSIYLEDEGVVVSDADCAESALELENLEELDLAIVDMRMPEMRGDELIPILHKKNSNMKFLIYTGSHEFEINRELKSVGMRENDIIFKPLLNLASLSKKIEEILERK